MYENFTEQILLKLGIQPNDIAYNNSIKITYKKLILTTLMHRSSSKCSEYLGISTRTLERLFPKVFPNLKGSTAPWSYKLLSLICIRYCSSCDKYKDLDQDFGVSRKCLECDNEYSKAKRDANPEAARLRSKEHYKNNRHYYISKSSKRRDIVSQQTPKWAKLSIIEDIYQCCPEGCHVDHIIPLQGDNVCGLHVETNLQYLDARDNLSKGNRFIGE